jgi:hypothetical protein
MDEVSNRGAAYSSRISALGIAERAARLLGRWR